MRIIPRRLVSYNINDFKAVWAFLFSKKNKSQVKQFEDEFSGFIGVDHAKAVSSAREGFSCLIDSLNLSESDEVILSAYNYHVIPIILKEKGLKPVFVDIDADTLNINPDLIEQAITAKTKCMVMTHLFGRACSGQRIEGICRKHNIILIEDAAHSCGAEDEGQKVGSFGDFSLFSFGTGKCLVTLGGGMIVSKNKELFHGFVDKLKEIESKENKLKSLIFYLKSFVQILLTNRILFAILIYPWLLLCNLFHFDPIESVTGDKYSPEDVRSKSLISPFTEFQAVLGISQIRRLEHINENRIAKANTLRDGLKNIKQVRQIDLAGHKNHVVLSYTIIVEDKKHLRSHLLQKGIDTKESSMRNCVELFQLRGDYPELKSVDNRIIELPCSQHLCERDMQYQIKVLANYFGNQ